MIFRANVPTTWETSFSVLSSKYLDNNVRFSLKYTISDKKFCILNCNKDEVRAIYKTLWEKELLSWQQIQWLPRQKWISIEKKDTDNHKMLKSINPEFNTFGHLYVKDTQLWRIFWWIKNDLFYILLIDIKWKINH